MLRTGKIRRINRPGEGNALAAALVQVVEKHPVGQVFQQIFTAQELIALGIEMLQDVLVALSRLSLVGQAIKTIVKIGGAAAKIEHRIGHAVFGGLNVIGRQGTGGKGGRFGRHFLDLKLREARAVGQRQRQAALQAPAITAATGIDAMVHAIEAYTSRGKHNAYSDLLAREALRLLDAHLQTAIHDGTHLEARQNMLLGAMLAGQAFANAPVAAVHALAYPLGGHFHLPHGLSNALVLLEVLRFNLPAAAVRYAELYRALDPGAAGDALTLAQRLIDRLEGHLAASTLPRRLSELSIPEAHLPVLAADAMKQTRLLVNNPRELGEADALAIYQAVF